MGCDVKRAYSTCGFDEVPFTVDSWAWFCNSETGIYFSIDYFSDRNFLPFIC